MSTFIAFTIFGLFSGAAYAIVASGLTLTYTTTRVFNIAHGALGMVMSFVFWDVSVRQGLPPLPALLLVVGVIAPATGWFIQRFVARGLGDAPVSVSLVVTVALLVACIGTAQQIWPPAARTVKPFFPNSSFTIAGTNVTAHQALTIVLSGVVAAGLYGLLTRTRVGTAMRASVDNPELLRLFGGRPDTVAALSWAIGTSLAALGGILLVSQVGLDYYALTLLVISAFAAAVFGRLKSLPLTFAGGMALGLAEAYAKGYLPTDGLLSKVGNVIAPLFLFAVVIGMPQTQLRIGQVKGIVTAPVPSLRASAGWGAALVLGMAVYTAGMGEADLLLLGTAATYAIVMLSLVLLTGYGGHVSLGQFTFAGVGALTYAKLDEPNLVGLLVSALVAGAVGALVALPVIRLTGLYLALATLAFAVLMDKLVFQADFAFGFGGALTAERLSILGTRIESTQGYVLVMVVFFVLTAIALLTLRRGVLGRLLIALRDSPAACGTLGLDARWFRVGLFGLSAAIAGLAGGLFAGLRGTIGAADFQFFSSLTLLLFAVVFGVTSVTGALLGGYGLMQLPVQQSENPGVAGLLFVVISVAAILLARNPNGIASYVFRLGRLLEERYGTQVRARVPDLAGLGLPGRRDRSAATSAQDEDVWDEDADNLALIGDPGHTRSLEGTDGSPASRVDGRPEGPEGRGAHVAARG
ncbi:ABC transporter permease [Nocardioides sp. TRM66260-LWL]|uniref:ABC transporter permease n=1 Tax=Nocardioides sp. TRM66260-LWL TaxID=2874478 RepID=UPI001CC3EB94|nr:ABC transporter permease [Nocardioides sp. TRM66260-LWL]MBZ5734615.1 ABC transporter permease [Nocardioides sp. TRM66260-LWL]